MDQPTENTIYNMGYMCSDDERNPFPPGSDGHRIWQKGYDESIITNAQNLPENHVDVIRLGCGYHDD